jgi:hypothetical protein
MPRDDFVLLLARQRSGTNPLRSVLETHHEIFSVPEVFNDHPTPDWELEVETNYVNFLTKRVGGDLRAVLAVEDHRELFRDFLEYVRCFTDRRFVVIDVKYNSTHHVMKYWRFMTEQPFLFDLVKDERIRVFNLTRHNYLRYWLSEVKAHLTHRWEAFDERVVGNRPWYLAKYAGRPAVDDVKVHLDVAKTLQTLELCRSENELVAASFAGYERYLELDYEDLFLEIGAPVSEEALGRISDWLGIEPDFAERRPQYKKQSVLPLADTVENYDEIASALRGTPFEYCLEDERIYRRAPDLGVD